MIDTTTRASLKSIIDGMCAGNASLATDTILAEYVVIPKRDLPPTSYDPTSQTDRWVTVDVSGPMTESAHAVTGTAQAWEMARHWAAIALSVEVQETKARDKRRDELAQEFSDDGAYAYRFASPALQSAIDRIIEIEARP